MKFLTVLDENQNTPQEVLLESIEDGSIWKRSGSCNRCGLCCVDLENLFEKMDGNYQPIDTPLEQVVPGKCAYFRWESPGVGMCLGRDTLYYQSGCKYWPSITRHVENIPECGFTFEKISDAQ